MLARCPSCSAEVAPDLRSCPACSAPLPESSVSVDAAERRLLTVVFADVAGSTRLSQALDPEDMRDLLGAYQRECVLAVERWGGHIAQYLGDGVLVYFGYPAAREDDARRAVGAALDIAARVPRLPMPRSMPPLQVRLGVHTGITVVGAVGSGQRRENLAVGDAPNVAARIQAVAEPNTVVVTDSTRRLVHGFYSFEPSGQRLAGVDGAVELYRLVGTTGASRPIDAAAAVGLTEFVGRAAELERLQLGFRRVLEGGAHAVLVEGEAGIGKSRLLQELKEYTAQSTAHLLEWHCSPDAQGSPLRPVAESVARRSGLNEDDTPQQRLAKLEHSIGKLQSPPEDSVRVMAQLLSIPTGGRYGALETRPQSLRRRTLETVIDLVRALSDERALLLVVEDLHWADPSTLELIGLALERLEKAHTLLVLTSRPGFEPPWAVELERMRLERLPAPAVERMIKEIALGRELPHEVFSALAKRSEGVPLFVEEITRTVLESGVLAEKGDHYELSGPLLDSDIPFSIQASLMARLDRLGSSKRLAQVGSALGRSFRYDLLRAVDDAPDVELLRDLAELVRADLLLVSGEPPEAEWSFKHALIRDAAYDSFLRRARRQLHQRIAETLLARFPEVAANEPEVVAGHFDGAGLAPQAVSEFRRAGERALSRAANREAIAHFQRALSLVEELPQAERAQTELGLQLRLFPALMAIKGWAAQEVEDACQRARDLCEQLGSAELLPPALWGLWTVPFLRGNLEPALDAAQRVLDLAHAAKSPLLSVLGHHAVGFTHFFRGELNQARAHAEAGIALYTAAQERAIVDAFQFSSTVALRVFRAASLWLLGDAAAGEHELAQAEVLASELAHPPSTAFFLSFAAHLGFYRRDYEQTRQVASRMLSLSEAEGYVLWIAVAKIYRGWSTAALGDVAAGVAETKQGLELFRKTGSALTLVHFMVALSETLQMAGQHEEALAVLEQGIEHAASHGEHLLEPELHRLKAEHLFERGGQHLAAAEQSLQRALGIARGQDARALERRAASALSRMRAEPR